ncbi:MAG TPA: 2-oxoacid:ferredoxin oxidoreductase subunit beta [Candidatus Saccharimonadales bacterium]|nr:2-oxoacid:ferredoxin oxidoreductase subunit beta [Candidatus Saccharimonadales bacterium]
MSTATAVTESASPLKAKDFRSDQEVRWCPGCGDYAILNAVAAVFPKLGYKREDFVVVSGIGCSSRFPYYMGTYGFHSIHGRAPAIATGLKTARPDLHVWVVTGDGDGLSIGGNHLIHAVRRNADLKILLFNNRIYGLTKGQYSPTSEFGKKTASSPYGTVERPFVPIALALAAEATFVARSVDVYKNHLQDVLEAAANHNGAAFVEIYQNCNIFNDGAFSDITERQLRETNNLTLEHGKPMIFGTKDQRRGIRRKGGHGPLEAFAIEGPEDEAKALVHDETAQDPGLAYALAHLAPPAFPAPIGVFRRIEAPSYEERVWDQIHKAQESKPHHNLDALLRRGDVWQIEKGGEVVELNR